MVQMRAAAEVREAQHMFLLDVAEEEVNRWRDKTAQAEAVSAELSQRLNLLQARLDSALEPTPTTSVPPPEREWEREWQEQEREREREQERDREREREEREREREREEWEHERSELQAELRHVKREKAAAVANTTTTIASSPSRGLNTGLIGLGLGLGEGEIETVLLDRVRRENKREADRLTRDCERAGREVDRLKSKLARVQARSVEEVERVGQENERLREEAGRARAAARRAEEAEAAGKVVATASEAAAAERARATEREKWERELESKGRECEEARRELGRAREEVRGLRDSHSRAVRERDGALQAVDRAERNEKQARGGEERVREALSGRGGGGGGEGEGGGLGAQVERMRNEVEELRRVRGGMEASRASELQAAREDGARSREGDVLAAKEEGVRAVRQVQEEMRVELARRKEEMELRRGDQERVEAEMEALRYEIGVVTNSLDAMKEERGVLEGRVAQAQQQKKEIELRAWADLERAEASGREAVGKAREEERRRWGVELEAAQASVGAAEREVRRLEGVVEVAEARVGRAEAELAVLKEESERKYEELKAESETARAAGTAAAAASAAADVDAAGIEVRQLQKELSRVVREAEEEAAAAARAYSEELGRVKRAAEQEREEGGVAAAATATRWREEVEWCRGEIGRVETARREEALAREKAEVELETEKAARQAACAATEDKVHVAVARALGEARAEAALAEAAVREDMGRLVEEAVAAGDAAMKNARTVAEASAAAAAAEAGAASASQLRDLQREVETARAEAGAATRRLEAGVVGRKRAGEELRRVERQLEAVTEKERLAVAAATAAAVELETLRGEVRKQTRSYAELQRVKEGLEAEVEKLVVKLGGAQEETSRVKEEMERVGTEGDRRCTRMKLDLERLGAELASAQAAEGAAREAVKVIRGEAEQLHAAVKVAESGVVTAQDLRARAQEELSAFREEAGVREVELRTAMLTLQRELEEAVEAGDGARELADEARREMEVIGEEAEEELERVRVAGERELTRVRGELEEVKQELTRASTAAAAVTGGRRGEAAAVGVVAEVEAEARRRAESELQRLRESSKTEILALRAEVERAKRRAGVGAEAQERALEALRAQLSTVSVEAGEATTALAVSKREALEHGDRIAWLEAEVERVKGVGARELAHCEAGLKRELTAALGKYEHLRLDGVKEATRFQSVQAALESETERRTKAEKRLAVEMEAKTSQSATEAAEASRALGDAQVATAAARASARTSEELVVSLRAQLAKCVEELDRALAGERKALDDLEELRRTATELAVKRVESGAGCNRPSGDADGGDPSNTSPCAETLRRASMEAAELWWRKECEEARAQKRVAQTELVSLRERVVEADAVLAWWSQQHPPAAEDRSSSSSGSSSSSSNSHGRGSLRGLVGKIVTMSLDHDEAMGALVGVRREIARVAVQLELEACDDAVTREAVEVEYNELLRRGRVRGGIEVEKGEGEVGEELRTARPRRQLEALKREVVGVVEEKVRLSQELHRLRTVLKHAGARDMGLEAGDNAP